MQSAIAFNSDHFSVDTEVWKFEDETNKGIRPALPDGHYRYGIALYAVNFDFCSI